MVWDKGGSGLVFYTDAAYWDQQDGGILTAVGAELSMAPPIFSCDFFPPVQILMRSVQKKMIGM